MQDIDEKMVDSIIDELDDEVISFMEKNHKDIKYKMYYEQSYDEIGVFKRIIVDVYYEEFEE